MSVRHKQIDDRIWLIEVSGRLDQQLTPELESEMLTLLDQENGTVLIVVDLSTVNYINSGGLRCLVTAWRQAKAKKGNLVLSGLRNRVQEVFTMVGFDKVFTIYATNNAAIKALKQADNDQDALDNRP